MTTLRESRNGLIAVGLLIIGILYVGWKFPDSYFPWIYGVLFGAVITNLALTKVKGLKKYQKGHLNETEKGE